MAEAEDLGTAMVATEEVLIEPIAMDGPRPDVLYPAPPEQAPVGAENVPSPGWCWIECKFPGVYVRSGSNGGSPYLGTIGVGDRLDAKWQAEFGARVQGCGGSTEQWIKVWFRGTWGYVPLLCVNYYRPS